MYNYEPTEGAVDTEVDVQLNDSETDDRLVHTHTLTQRLILYIFYCYSNIMQDVAGHDLQHRQQQLLLELLSLQHLSHL